jgi:hypothetical protein
MDPARRDEERGWHMEEARPDHAGRASVNKADCGGLTTALCVEHVPERGGSAGLTQFGGLEGPYSATREGSEDSRLHRGGNNKLAEPPIEASVDRAESFFKSKA